MENATSTLAMMDKFTPNLMTNTPTADPKDHVGHTIVEDRFARDFGGRSTPGNGWCGTCGVPVAIEVQRPGTYLGESETTLATKPNQKP